eukprot:2027204-Rhodomonas_salina.1
MWHVGTGGGSRRRCASSRTGRCASTGRSARRRAAAARTRTSPPLPTPSGSAWSAPSSGLPCPPTLPFDFPLRDEGVSVWKALGFCGGS